MIPVAPAHHLRKHRGGSASEPRREGEADLPGAGKVPGMRLRRTAHRVRLLLCDDQALFRAGMKAVLAEHSAIEVVGEAADGQAAIEETARLRPDVVLMDVEMPRL